MAPSTRQSQRLRQSSRPNVSDTSTSPLISSAGAASKISKPASKPKSTTTRVSNPSKPTATAPPRPNPTPKAAGPSDLPLMLFPNATAFSSWLTTHASTSTGIWLTLSKSQPHSTTTTTSSATSTPPTTLSPAQALDLALAHGWINGQARRSPSSTTSTFLSRYTPRTSKSLWSAINVAHVERLRAAGKMTPRGEAEVSKAQADGRWEGAYGGSEAMAAVAHEVLEVLEADGEDGERKWSEQERQRAKAYLLGLEKERGKRYELMIPVAQAVGEGLRRRRIEGVIAKVLALSGRG